MKRPGGRAASVPCERHCGPKSTCRSNCCRMGDGQPAAGRRRLMRRGDGRSARRDGFAAARTRCRSMLKRCSTGCNGGRPVSGCQILPRRARELSRTHRLGHAGQHGLNAGSIAVREIAAQGASEVILVNLRERAGWSADAASAGPKMAALAASRRTNPRSLFCQARKRRRHPRLRWR
jgi:hypothetical protein